jgi:hypothetical protein
MVLPFERVIITFQVFFFFFKQDTLFVVFASFQSKYLYIYKSWNYFSINQIYLYCSILAVLEVFWHFHLGSKLFC